MVTRMSYQCPFCQMEVSSGPQGVLPVRCRSVVAPRVSYQSDGEQYCFLECLTSQVEVKVVPRVSYWSGEDQEWSQN